MAFWAPEIFPTNGGGGGGGGGGVSGPAATPLPYFIIGIALTALPTGTEFKLGIAVPGLLSGGKWITLPPLLYTT